MLNQALTQLLNSNKRAAAINAILLANSFGWYMYAFNYIRSFAPDPSILQNQLISQAQFMQIMIIHFMVLFPAIIIGAYFSSHKTTDSQKFLRLWMLIGVFLSLTPLLAGASYWGLMILSIIVAANFGFGIAASFGYFASTTPANNRGKLGGAIFLIVGISVSLLSFLENNVFIVTLVLVSWRITGFLLLNYAKPLEKLTNPPKESSQKNLSYRQIISNKTFLLYLIPWIIFLFINSASFPINTVAFSPEIVSSGGNIEYILAGISAVIFGFLADSKGRKRLAVVGFAMLGLGYAILAFTSQEYGFWIYTLIDGITWGIFVSIFLFSIWGDISEGKNATKIYAIGILPYLLSSLIRILAEGQLTAYAQNSTDFAAIFSFFSFFLFIAVLPLVMAPETMSEQIIRSNDLKSYIEKAKKQVQKRDTKEEETSDDAEDSENQSDEYKEAQKLAEKYY
jgi:MFS family permease